MVQGTDFVQGPHLMHQLTYQKIKIWQTVPLRAGWGEKDKGPTMMIALELLSWQLCHYVD